MKHAVYILVRKIKGDAQEDKGKDGGDNSKLKFKRNRLDNAT